MKKTRFTVLLLLLLLCGALLCACFGDDTSGKSEDGGSTDGGYYPDGGGMNATVTFDSDGGSAVDPITATLGDFVSNPPTPTRTGYEFLGWYEDGYGDSWDGRVHSENMTLRAKWEPIFYNLHLNLNRFEDLLDYENIEYIYDQFCTVEDEYGNVQELPCPLDETMFFDRIPYGFKFMGWFKDENYTQPITHYGMGTGVQGNFEIYGKFEFWPYSFNKLDNGTYSFAMTHSGSIQNLPQEDFEALTEVVIPATYEGLPVTEIRAEAFYGWSHINSITVPDSITTIGNYAFVNISMGKIKLPDNIKLLGYSAISEDLLYTTEYNGGIYAATKNNPYAIFLRPAGTSKITSIQLHENTRVIASEAFIYDDSSWNNIIGHDISEIVLPDNLVGIGHDAFKGCAQLRTVTLGKNLEYVSEYAFQSCKILNLNAPVDFLDVIPGATVEKLTLTAGDAIDANTLKDYPALKSVTLCDSIKTIHKNAFDSNKKLSEVNIATGVTSLDSLAFIDRVNVTKILYNGCYYMGNATNPYFLLYSSENSALTSANIHPNTKIIWNKAFFYNNNLAAPTIPESVIAIGSQAFSSTAMASWNGTARDGGIYIGNTSNPYLILLGVQSGVTEFTMKDSTLCYSNTAFKGNTTLQKVTLSSSVTKVAANMFQNCSSLQSVYLPDGVTEIGDTAFNGCSALTELRVPSTVTKLGKNILDFSVLDNPSTGKLYANCSKALYSDGTGFYLGNENNHFHILYALFSNSTSSTVSYAVKPTTVVIAPNVLRSKFTALTLTDSVKIISDYAFGNYSSYTSNSYSASLASITLGKGVEYIGEGAFYACKGLIGSPNEYGSLTTLALPDSLTYLGASAFDQCEKLRAVSFGSGLTEIKESTFSLCYALSEIRIPSNIKSIEENAFWLCTGVKKVYIANGVEYIGKKAFNVNYDLGGSGNMLYDGHAYCGASTKPEGWHAEWISSNMTVHFGSAV